MGKFVDLETDIYSIFDSIAWTTNGISAVPSNFPSNGVSNSYIRVNVLPNGVGLNRASAMGILQIDIFIPAGEGTHEASVIADMLNPLLVNRSKNLSSGVTQFGNSSVNHLGLDKDNPNLHRSIYSIPFNYFGEI